MILIRLFDKIIDTYYFLLKYKKCFTRFSIEIFIVVIVLACYASRDTKTLVVIKPEKLMIEKKNDNYLLKILEKKDSINTDQLRHYPSLQPIQGKDIMAISTKYGMITNAKYGMSQFHNGMDFAARKGTLIYASGDGVVINSNFDNANGNYIRIDHKNGYITFYGHMNTINVIKGQKVLRGEIIGTVGNSGISTGYHLHYAITYKGNTINPNIFR